MTTKREIGANLAIFSTPVLYGGFYVATEIAMQQVDIFWVTALRMVIACIGFLPFLARLKQITKKVFLANFWIAIAVFIGMMSQSFAIQLSSVSTTGFIAALFIIFTPIIQRVLFKKKMRIFFIIPILISCVGYYVMFRNPSSNEFEFGVGDWFAVLGSLMIAFQIVLTGRYIGENDAVVFGFLQVLLILVLGTISAIFFEKPPVLRDFNQSTWTSLIYLGIGATILPYVFQAWGQKYVNSMVAALIIVSEPIFATIFGVLFGNEVITLNFLIGGALILISAFISVIFENRVKK